MSYSIEFETNAGHIAGCSFDGMFVPGEPGRTLARADTPSDFDAEGHLLPKRMMHGVIVDVPAVPVEAAAMPVDPVRIQELAPVAGAGVLVLS